LQQVKIGVSAEERATPQGVRFDLVVRYPRSAPKAVKTDKLKDTLCYADLCEKVRKVCSAKEFKLLEHIAQEVFNAVKKAAGAKTKIEVHARKIHPPVADLIDGVSFSLVES
jgi:dihydroneopterin aldolase